MENKNEIEPDGGSKQPPYASTETYKKSRPEDRTVGRKEKKYVR